MKRKHSFLTLDVVSWLVFVGSLPLLSFPALLKFRVRKNVFHGGDFGGKKSQDTIELQTVDISVYSLRNRNDHSFETVSLQKDLGAKYIVL